MIDNLRARMLEDILTDLVRMHEQVKFLYS
jgi:hypothetical protein